MTIDLEKWRKMKNTYTRHNESILERMRGVPANMPSDDAEKDERNPNADQQKG